MKRGRSIVRTAGDHPLAATIHDKIEEEIETATATFNDMVRRCEELNAIYEEEDEFSQITITHFRGCTVGYDSDNNRKAEGDREERHEMMLDDLEPVQCAYNVYRANLECRNRNLMEYLDSATAGRRYIWGFRHRLNQGVEEGTFPYPPLNNEDLEPLQFW